MRRILIILLPIILLALLSCKIDSTDFSNKPEKEVRKPRRRTVVVPLANKPNERVGAGVYYTPNPQGVEILKNNNPCGTTNGSGTISWEGSVGVMSGKSGHVIFSSKIYGWRAALINLSTKYNRGINTLEKLSRNYPPAKKRKTWLAAVRTKFNQKEYTDSEEDLCNLAYAISFAETSLVINDGVEKDIHQAYDLMINKKGEYTLNKSEEAYFLNLATIRKNQLFKNLQLWN